MIRISCKYCDHAIDCSVSWIKLNERVFCDTCCKSFEIKLDIPEEKSEDDFILADEW